MNPYAIIFDLDGTLIDSESIAHAAWQCTLQQFGIEFAPEDNALILGIELVQALRTIKTHFALPHTIDEINRLLSAEWSRLSRQGLPTMPGVMPVLDALDARGICWGIATNSDRAYTLRHLANVDLADRAHAIVAVDDVPNPKPAPDVYLTCARALGFDPADCIAVEDSIVGHRAAAAAGMTVVVVGPDANSAEFPLADHIFHSLPAFLQNLDQITV